jgi:hypothetical protein
MGSFSTTNHTKDTKRTRGGDEVNCISLRNMHANPDLHTYTLKRGCKYVSLRFFTAPGKPAPPGCSQACDPVRFMMTGLGELDQRLPAGWDRLIGAPARV